MSDPRPVRLAVLGCGQAALLAARALRHLGGVSCAYASRDPERAARFSRALGGRAFGSYDDALSAPDVDAVLVATPPASHFDLAMRALNCGKSVVLEKPPTLGTSELDTLGSIARSLGRHVMVAENYFYKPLARALRELIAVGAVGELLFIHVNALKAQRAAGWRSDPEIAGGALFEGGIHWVDLLANLGPPVEHVEGFLPGLNGTAGPDRSAFAVFRYATGAVGTLSYSWETASALRGLRLSRVYGREGSIAFESNGLFLAAWGRRTRRIAFPGLRDISGRRAMWSDFVTALQANAEPRYDLGRARRDLQLVEAVYASARNGGRWA